MSETLRFLYVDNNDVVHPLPKKHLSELSMGVRTMPEFKNTKLRFIEVMVETNKKRRATKILGVSFHLIALDSTGHRDSVVMEEALRLAVNSIAYGGTEEQQEAARLSNQQYALKFKWIPESEDMVQKIKNAVFKSKGEGH